MSSNLPPPVSVGQSTTPSSRRSIAQCFVLVNCILLIGAVGIIGLTCALRQTPSPWHFQSAMLNLLVLVILRLSRLFPEANNGVTQDYQMVFQLRSVFSDLIFDVLAFAMTAVAICLFLGGCFGLLANTTL
ncbi:hypothetical protein M407DRAFT_199920 [Tulasnella calospora MUT 4182]|uniref:Uncharacterized protein n=1 Tax=Tulasnella calospora MUT 4182 TaxID=1051891 RepID=A0A0C3KYU5_9AGAM|nr:hypothetical protein M407DRAFT_199920 [Tulasnella calospora MUT 4182]